MAGKHRAPSLPENARKTTVYIDEDIKERARELAEKDGRSLSTWAAMLIEAEVERIESELDDRKEDARLRREG